MDSKIRVGIGGLGRSGWNIHARTLKGLSDKYEVVAVSDPLEDRRREAVAEFGCRAYSDFESLVKDEEVELVVVATPSYLHAQHAIMALEASKDVVCEKPMATNLREADLMIEAANKSGRMLVVFHNSLFAPDYLKVKEIIDSGKLGRIILIKIYNHVFSRRWDWQTLKRFGGGELRNNGVHPIAQALQILGNKKPEVFCDLRKTLTLGDAEDHVKIVLRAESSPLIDIEVTRACAYPQSKWLVMGTHGGLVGNAGSLMWKYFNPAALPERKLEVEPVPDRSYNFEDIPWIEESWHLDKSSQSSAMIFYERLYSAIRYGGSPPVPLELAWGVMWVVEKCFEVAGLRDL